ncbi:MAG: BON domain-containing protein [Gemmataceae bacterium]|nr:BON domain-containing protein [Gemmataceae bacterium]
MRKGWKKTARQLLISAVFGLLASNSPGWEAPKKPQTPALEKIQGHRAESSGRVEAIRVQVAFLADPVLSGCDLAVVYKDGQIVLKGKTPNWATQERAMLVAKQITHLKVRDEIRLFLLAPSIPPRLSKETLQKNANAFIASELTVAYPGIKVEAGADGSLAVSGPVVSLEDKLEVSKKLRKLHGCHLVWNRMAVQPMKLDGTVVTLVTNDGDYWVPGREITQDLVIKTAAPNAPMAQVVSQPIEKPREDKVARVDVLTPPQVPDAWKGKSPSPTSLQAQTVSQPKAVEKTNTPVKAKTAELGGSKPSVLSGDLLLEKKATATSAQTRAGEPIFIVPPALSKIEAHAVPLVSTQEKTTPLPVTSVKKEPLPVQPSAAKKETTPSLPLAAKKETKPAAAPTKKDWAGAHDSRGSIHVRPDAIGFPTGAWNASTAKVKNPVTGGQNPVAASDTNPSYVRPYLSISQTSDGNSQKDKAQWNSVLLARLFGDKSGSANRIEKPILEAKTPVKPPVEKKENAGTATVNKSPAVVPNPGKTSTTLLDKIGGSTTGKSPAPVQAKTPVVAKPVVATTAVNPAPGNSVTGAFNRLVKGIKGESDKPRIATGTITFEDSPEDSTAQGAAKASELKKIVEQACGRLARKVETTCRPDGTILVEVQISDPSMQPKVSEKLLALPEIASPKVSLDIQTK